MLEGDKDGPWTVTTLKVYFERIICDLNRRITGLDNYAQQAKDKERDFYSRAQHDDFADSISDQFSNIRKEIEALTKPQWTVWLGAITLFISVTGTLWWLAVQPIKLDLQHLKDQDAGIMLQRKERGEYIDSQNKIINDRIDRLYELYRDLNTQHMELKFPPPKKPP